MKTPFSLSNLVLNGLKHRYKIIIAETNTLRQMTQNQSNKKGRIEIPPFNHKTIKYEKHHYLLSNLVLNVSNTGAKLLLLKPTHCAK